MAPELPKPDIRPQLRELLAWYDDVLGGTAAGALVGPGVAERLREEQNLTARCWSFWMPAKRARRVRSDAGIRARLILKWERIA